VSPPDVGFLCVSERGHTEDTTDGLAHLHRNGGGGDRTMKMMTMSGSMGNNNATTTSSYEAAASK
jgi:hypothetical protein